jgi:SAM-dependent methyltransferase
MIGKLIRNAGRIVALFWYALWSPQLIYKRYVVRRPAAGAIRGEQLAHDMFWERRLGATTGDWKSIDVPDSVGYEGTPYLLLLEVFRHLPLRADDVFVDLGCGKGRVLLMALRSTVGRVVGVDLSAEFLESARLNLESCGSESSRYRLFHGPVLEFDFDPATVLFLFNPFGAKTMREMLVRVDASLRRRPRDLRIVYVNPVQEEVLDGTSWLRRTEVWPRDAWPDNSFLPKRSHVVSFWTTGKE